MATLLEEGVCVIKDKKVAKWILDNLEKPLSKEHSISKNARERTKKALKEGIEWVEKIQL